MITLKIIFILAFSLKQKMQGNKEPKLNKAKTENGNAKDQKDKRNKKGAKEDVEIVPVNPKYVFEIDNVVGSAHIEYDLFPNKSKYQIDVKCWGPIAKIFANDGQITLKTVIRNNVAWVPIYVEHYLEHMTLEEVKNFRNYVVNFEISVDEKKLGKLATADKSRKFFTIAEDAELNAFVKAYDRDPNMSERSSVVGSLNKDVGSVGKHISFPKNDFVTELSFPDNFDIVYEIIDKHCSGAGVECKDFVLPCSYDHMKAVRLNLDQKSSKQSEKRPAEEPQKVKKAEKPGKNTERIKVQNITVRVPAEVFFTDPIRAVYHTEENACEILKHVYATVSSEHLLSRSQKLCLDPLVVKLRKLSNLPVDILREIGITSIYLAYSIPSIANCKSLEKPVSKKIIFNDNHIFFHDSVSKLKLIEFLQTRRLHVEIYGTKESTPSKSNYQLFGREPDDKNISKITTYKKPTRIVNTTATNLLLAVCTFDISSVVQNVWDFKEKGQCHEPGLTLYEKCMGYYDTLSHEDMRNVNEVNISFKYLEPRNPIMEETLLSFGTLLKVEVYLMAPQTASLILMKIPNTFKRFFFILYSWELAKSIVTGIMKHNETIISQKKDDPVEDLQFVDVITGFLIDNLNSVTIFVEGISTGFILSIENITISNYELGKGKFFVNTDSVFEKRLYSTFIYEGLHVVTLRIPLYEILDNRLIYLSGNMPFACLEALKKLNLLFHASIYKSILQYNLLPKPEELLSLNIEWGVPLMITKEIEK